MKLNPNHVVPTLVHDGRVLIESSLINEYLEDVFPTRRFGPPMPPAATRCGCGSSGSTSRCIRPPAC